MSFPDNFLTLRTDIDDLFDNFPFMSMTPALTYPSTSMLMPSLSQLPEVAIDMQEDKNNFNIDANVPGYDKKDVDLNFDKQTNCLVLSGEQKSEKEYDEGVYHTKERKSNNFTRRIRLPKQVKDENISAKMEQGVLKITCPKLRPSLPAPTGTRGTTRQVSAPRKGNIAIK